LNDSPLIDPTAVAKAGIHTNGNNCVTIAV
jgi:hypothetical protein